MSENFGYGKIRGHGGVMVGVWMTGKDDADEMLKVLNAAMRAGIRSPTIDRWRAEVMNVRSRAHREDWPGWS